ncbi:MULTISPECIES: hypothetical protein [Streptomyces]|uniref:Lipoprotein n=1 Tax=Streptomyces bangladeshensis TaxID=295352 RepID=A0ABN3C2V9_9ACTN|nr:MULTISPECIES: hypothetical protein [unclassified Streptomyces]OYP15909.1 hypothetical protein CFC35_16505 [Streptomyces sp. FBKL.4005]BCM68839.1 hypothetical protein EASAB2608_04173 [Streptomyces sp. EAS-AB2608]
MRLRRALFGVASLVTAIMVAACGSSQDETGADNASSKQVAMDEQQAMKRAEEIIHQAVDGMSPKPTLKRVGPVPIGACVARDDGGSDDRVQLSLTYQLTGVPAGQAKSLVRQARDAWVKRGYKFQSSDADWSDPFPTVSMRTEPDDFWMDAITGVLDRAKGTGVASIGVTSPCFAPSDATATADPASFRRTAPDEQAERRALDHSSRIYDALQVRHAPTTEGEGLGTYQDAEATYAHHTWSTEPLADDTLAQVMQRARAYFASAGWTVRHAPMATGVPALMARHAADGAVAQLAPSTDGTLRVAVSTPAVRPGAASV